MIISHPNNKKVIDRLHLRVDYLTAHNPKLYQKIDKLLEISTRTHFQKQGRPKWQPRKGIYSWPILYNTGKLLQSVLTSIKKRWQHSRHRHVKYVYSVEYGKFHQFGTRYLPIRQFIGLIHSEIRELENIINTMMRNPEKF